MKVEPSCFDQEPCCLKIKHQIGLRTSSETDFLFEFAVAFRNIGRIGYRGWYGIGGVERLNGNGDEECEGAGRHVEVEIRGNASPDCGRSDEDGHHRPARV